MSLNTKCNIVLILTSLGYGVLLAIMILGAIFPGKPSPIFGPWYAWAAVVEVVAYGIAVVTTGIIVQWKDKRIKEQYE